MTVQVSEMGQGRIWVFGRRQREKEKYQNSILNTIGMKYEVITKSILLLCFGLQASYRLCVNTLPLTSFGVGGARVMPPTSAQFGPFCAGSLN